MQHVNEVLEDETFKRIPVTDVQSYVVFLHDTYERLAPEFGYETRPETRAFDPDSPNGKLMAAAVRHLLRTFSVNMLLDVAEQRKGARHDTPTSDPL